MGISRQGKLGAVDGPVPDTALAGPAFGYVDFGVAHGLSREALIAAARLDERLRGDPDARISTFAYDGAALFGSNGVEAGR